MLKGVKPRKVARTIFLFPRYNSKIVFATAENYKLYRCELLEKENTNSSKKPVDFGCINCQKRQFGELRLKDNYFSNN